LVIGGGQAGLAMSRCLSDRGLDHVVLDRGRIAERWRSERWDSLRLLTPNWQSRLPGYQYTGPDPDGYMTRDEVVSFLDLYARKSRGEGYSAGMKCIETIGKRVLPDQSPSDKVGGVGS
jgi:putative flavoprotein involved in K+ transport